MRTLVDLLLRPLSNVEEITLHILHNAGVKFTYYTVLQSLNKHPRFPSMASISDVLCNYGIETLGLMVNDCYELSKTEQFFLVQIKNDDKFFFAIVYRQSSNTIDWYNPIRHHRETIIYDDFCQMFTGYILLINMSNKKDENHYKSHHQVEKAQKVIETTLFLFPFLLAIVSFRCCVTIYKEGLLVLLLFGCLIGFFLLLFEYNQQSPIVSRICSISRQSNCRMILFSKASCIAGVPWAVIGTTYFLGTFLSLCLSEFNNQILHLVALIHIPILGYVAYSLFYQSKVVHKWCPFCTSIDVILLFMLICLWLDEAYNESLPPHLSMYVTIFSCYLLSFAIVYLIWELSLEYKAHKNFERKLCGLKYNKDVFDALLHKSRKIEAKTDNIGITLGNPKGSIHIIKVCHPYCVRCADIQPVLQRIVDNNRNVRLQIIFAVDPNDIYYCKTPVDLFLSLNHDEADMEEILADWYKSTNKDLKEFELKYPVKRIYTSENKVQAEEMLQFCKKVGITGTPTIFINGYELPNNYCVEDLMYDLL